MKTKKAIIIIAVTATILIIMNLTDLGLNRFLYKDTAGQTPDSSLTMVNNSNGGSTSSGGDGQTKYIAPGTIIQTSPSDNRVEMNPDDTLKAYNAGIAVVTIDKNGISVTGGAIIVLADIGTANINTANVNTLNVATKFNYIGIPQPVIYSGKVSASGVLTQGPTGWSVTHAGTGDYIITHNLGLTPPVPMKVFFTSESLIPIDNAVGVLVNDLDDFFEIYFTDPATDTAVDVDFQFMAIRYLP